MILSSVYIGCPVGQLEYNHGSDQGTKVPKKGPLLVRYLGHDVRVWQFTCLLEFDRG